MTTYSTSLRAELPTGGTQAGVWGDTTNSNLNYIFDSAIAGYITVPISLAAQPLTYTNGPTTTNSLNQAVYQALKLTAGGVGAAFAIYAPPVSKTYIIYNATAYTATIYNSSVIGNTTAGGTGVTIPAGETMTVVTDGGTAISGAGFTQQNTALISPHLSGTPTAPTATSGDNSTQIATTAFVQINGTPTGGLMLWPTASPPANWLICNGTAVSRATYATLFAVVGTTFGAGNGSTTFNLPNYTDRMPIGAGSSYSVNSQGGSATTTLTTTELPSHSHSASSSSSSSSTFSGSAGSTSVTNIDHNHNESWAAPDFGGPITAARLNANGVQPVTGGMNSNTTHNHAFTPAGSVSTSTSTTTTVGSTGSGAAFTNLPPYLGIYFIIKT
jgi:microcystin-dependent protein